MDASASFESSLEEDADLIDDSTKARIERINNSLMTLDSSFKSDASVSRRQSIASVSRRSSLGPRVSLPLRRLSLGSTNRSILLDWEEERGILDETFSGVQFQNSPETSDNEQF